jgi:hypothetical protein
MDLKTTCQMDRKQILDFINLDVEMFMTSFENAAKLLLEQKDKLEKEGWTNIHLKMNYYNEGEELVVMGMRLETDIEYSKRLADEQKKLLAAEKKAEKARKKYEELKSKYEL